MGLQSGRGIGIRHPSQLASPAQSELRAVTVPGQLRGKSRPHVLRPAVQVVVVEGEFGIGVDHGEAVAGSSAAGIRLVDESNREASFTDAPSDACAQNTGTHHHDVTGRSAACCHRSCSNCAGPAAGRREAMNHQIRLRRPDCVSGDKRKPRAGRRRRVPPSTSAHEGFGPGIHRSLPGRIRVRNSRSFNPK